MMLTRHGKTGGSERRWAGRAVSWLVLVPMLMLGPSAPVVSDDETGSGQAQLRTEMRSLDGLHVDVVLTNDGPDPVTVLTRDTPLDASQLAPSLMLESWVSGSDVTARGRRHWHPLAYEGRLAKRLPPGPDELLALAPGQSVSARVALEAGWYIEGAGDVRVNLAAPWRTSNRTPDALVARSAARRQRLDHDFTAQPMPAAVTLALLGTASPVDALRRLRTPQYAQCSVDQQRDIVDAAATAERLVSASVSALSALSADELARSPRYTTWFGAYTPSRAADVIGDLAAITATLADQSVRFNCDCDRAGVFAYVYPTRPYDIWLCPQFWRASLEGTDSRSGTVIHELSHFRIVAGTSDHVYSHARAQQLAGTNPALAIDNADTFEYFVENTPDIALRAGDGGGPAPPGTGPIDAPVASSTIGSLRSDQARLHAITSGEVVVLESLEGDADLQLYRGGTASLGRLLCESDEPAGSIDRCELTGAGPWTARVVAFSDTRYRLSVEAGPSSGIERPVDDEVGTGTGAAGGIGGGGGGGGAGAAGPFAALLIALLALVRARRAGRLVPALMLACAAGSGCAASDGAKSGASATQGETGPASVQMSLAAVQPVGTRVRVTLHNATDAPARVLSWNTPFEPILSADVFVVTADDGTRAAYTGPVVKRALPPPDEAWMTLQPGERRHVERDLARDYAMSAPGPWSVVLDAARLSLPALDGATPIEVLVPDAPLVLR